MIRNYKIGMAIAGAAVASLAFLWLYKEREKKAAKEEKAKRTFYLPANFGSAGAYAAELTMQANLLWCSRVQIRKIFVANEKLIASLDEFEATYLEGNLEDVASQIHELISSYNLGHRLRLTNKTDWPRPDLVALEKNYRPSLLPPPTPTEYVDQSYTWWGWGNYESRESEWLGHGYFWRSCPPDNTEPLDNMAGSSWNDYDQLEDCFFRLKKAKVITADYDLL